MKQEGKAHVYIKSNQIETKGYNSTQTDVLTSFEKEGSSGGQMPRLGIEAFEPGNQRVRGRLVSIKDEDSITDMDKDNTISRHGDENKNDPSITFRPHGGKCK